MDKIWVLGNSIDGVDKNIGWNPKEVISFDECDVLIVDTTTLTEKTIQSLDYSKAEQLFQEIRKRFVSGLVIICIASESFDEDTVDDSVLSNYFWSPINFEFHKTAKGKTINKDILLDYPFMNYIEKIKDIEIALDHGEIIMKNSSQSTRGNPPYDLWLIASKSRDILGGSFSKSPSLGVIHVLPLLKNNEESINTILSNYKIKKETPVPTWITSIDIPGIAEFEEKIKLIEKDIKTKEKERQEKISLKNKLERFKKLVYETDEELENVVKEALMLIGLKNVKNGQPGKDDLIFDFNDTKQFKMCAVEIKGVTGNVGLKDFRQLDHWVVDHLEKSIPAKGLMVANTFRKIDLGKSEKNRTTFSDFESFYKPRGICTLPTIVLLDFCKAILGGFTPDIKKIENVIINSNDVLTLSDLK